MVSISTVSDALKSFYLDVLINQLNNSVSPLYSKFKATSNFVTGKGVIKPVCYDLSSGVAALDEYGTLPTAQKNNYVLLKADLKNLYGNIEITDKAMRASENSQGAVVNLLNAEMEGLLATAKKNFSRMLYGDGSGKLATVAAAVSASASVTVDTTQYLKSGMSIDIVTSGTAASAVIASVDSATALTLSTAATIAKDAVITMPGSAGNEILGLPSIFDNAGTLYEVTVAGKDWMKPYSGTSTGTISDLKIQTAIDSTEANGNGQIDFIACSYGVRRAYQSILASSSRNVTPVELEGGFKTIGYAGIPIVADKYCPAKTMYLLDTTAFEMHQLCDWRWLEGDTGSVLKQIAGKASYSATLVKYANLICALPCGQARLSGITEA